VHRVRDHARHLAYGRIRFLPQPAVKKDGNPYNHNGNDAGHKDVTRALGKLLTARRIILSLGILL
jgi:hypothetical protein